MAEIIRHTSSIGPGEQAQQGGKPKWNMKICTNSVPDEVGIEARDQIDDLT